MARTASRGFDLNTIQIWAKAHQEELQVGGGAALLAFFFTQGLPLWNEDYSQWLAQANESIFTLLFRFLSPVTIEPLAWGYSDRPGQVLIYKVLSLLFGTWGTGYYFIKAAVFGGLIGTMYRWMRKLGVERSLVGLALGAFAVSTSVQASVIWHSDFGVYSQLILALILFWALPLVEKGPANISIYKRGLDKLPKNFTHFCIQFFLLVYFGAKVRADVRLAPVILLAYLAVFRREKAKVYAGPMGIAFLATLPWSLNLFKHLPPFIPGAAGSAGWTFSGFSVGRVFEFLFSGLLTWNAPALSVFSALGVFLVLGLLAFAAYRMYEERFEEPNEKWGFFLIWFAAAILVCGITAPQAASIQLRYLLLPLVPAAFLAAMGLQVAYKEFGKYEVFKYAVYAVAIAQLGFHGYHDINYRRDMGRTTVGVDKAYARIEREHGNAQLALAPGFPAYGYKTTQTPSIQGRKEIRGFEELNQYPAGNTWVLSWELPLDSRFSVEAVADGCASAVFDQLVGCPTAGITGPVVMKYLGNVAEIGQAEQMVKQGNLPGARQVLDTYLQRDPGNYGLAFVASLYAYQSGDYARMEQLYDKIGPYFDHHPSVAYNWALSKQGQHKYTEATLLFEKAYAMVPKDYAIGFNLADSYYREGKKTRALATVDDLIKTYPGNDALKNAYSNWSK